MHNTGESNAQGDLSFFADHSAAFRAILTAMFGEGLTTVELSDDCRLAMRTALDKRLLSDGSQFLSGPSFNDIGNNNNFMQLSAFVVTCLGQGNKVNELKELCKGAAEVKSQNEISVDRKPGDSSIVLNAIHTFTKDCNVLAEEAAKKIVYLSLLTKGSLYFKFHYKEYDWNSRPEIAYFKAVNNPLGLFETLHAAVPAAQPEDGASTPKKEKLVSAFRIEPLAVTEVLKQATDLTAAISGAMNLRPGFSPKKNYPALPDCYSPSHTSYLCQASNEWYPKGRKHAS